MMDVTAHEGLDSPGVPSTKRSLSVVIPAFNEEQNIAPTIDALIRALSTTVDDAEIIIVNDGSSDKTGEVADRLAEQHDLVNVVHNPRNMGLGYSYARGIERASKQWLVYVPGDNTWPYESFEQLFRKLGDADIVTSFATNPHVRPFIRRIISAGYTRTINIIFGFHLNYFNGLTIYPIIYLRSHPVKTYGFGFQAEMLVTAMVEGLSVVEVGLQIDERTAGGSKAVTLKNILSVLATLWRLCWGLRLR